MLPLGPGRAARDTRAARMGGAGDLFHAALDYHRAGDVKKASDLYRKILKRNPGDADAMHMLGLAHFESGRSERARQLIVKAAALAPQNAVIRFALGEILHAQGRYREAAAAYHGALEADPKSVAALTALAETLKAMGENEEALAALARAVELAPGSAEVRSNYAVALREAGRVTDAVAILRDAADAAPANPEIHFNLGNTLLAAGDLRNAEAAYRTALARDPGHMHAQLNLGVCLREQGRGQESALVLRAAIAAEPEWADAHWNLGLALLMDGEYAEGWREYEWRKNIPGFAMCRVPGPEWDGGALGSKTLLVHAEQGLGDAIQFARYARLAGERGGRVIFMVPRPLLPLFSAAQVCGEVIAAGGTPPDYDVQAPLMSLPHLLDPALTRAGAGIPYLAPNAALMGRWGEILNAKPGFKVGLCWQGNPAYRADAARSVPLREFAPLAKIPGVRLISLQKGFGAEQLAGVSGIEDFGPGFDENAGAFMDSAAAIAHLDLLICSDTAIAHLAGAMGRPVWLALSYAPDWRWGRAGETTPWYPHMRLFRQSAPGDWAGVFARIGEALAARTARA